MTPRFSARATEALRGRSSRARALAVIGTALASIVGYMALGSLGLLLPFVVLITGRLLVSLPVDDALPVVVAITLVLENPGEIPYSRLWVSPTQGLGDLWFSRNSLPAAPFVVCFVALLVRVLVNRAGPNCQPLAPRRRVTLPPRPFITACLVSVGALVAYLVWGQIRGGNLSVAITQLYPLLLLPVIGLAIAGSPTARHLQRLEQVIIWSALIKAGFCLFAYYKLRGQGVEYITTHSDSMLWVVAIGILFSQWIHGSRPDARRRLLLLAPVLGYALVANDRRIGWMGLIAVTLTVLALAPARTKANLRQLTLVLAPFVIAYSVVGWVSPRSTVFAPIQSIKSATSSTDASAASRDLEDLNLLHTLRADGPLGVGLGHEYLQVFGGDDLSALFEYKYYPHNSVLGFFAFGGAWAFPLYWAPVVVAMAYALFVGRQGPGSRDGPSPRVGAVAGWATGAMLAYMLQGWGDVGLQAPVAVVLGAVSCGAAGALPAVARAGLAPARSRPAPAHWLRPRAVRD